MLLNQKANKALHLPAFPLHSKASGELDRSLRNDNMKTRAFLIFCAVGLVPIALGYGAKPSATLDALFGITVDTTNLTHIMRAVMGLYLGMVVFWLCGAFRRPLAGPALAACAVFMLGLAAGRVLSFMLDGLPHWLLVVYAALEIVLGLVAITLYRAEHSEGGPAS
jgi:amino acid transporter